MSPQARLSSLMSELVHGESIGTYDLRLGRCFKHGIAVHVVVMMPNDRACLACVLEAVRAEYGGIDTPIDPTSVSIGKINRTRSRYKWLREEKEKTGTTDLPGSTARQSEAVEMYRKEVSDRGAHGAKTRAAEKLGISLQALSALLKRAGIK